MRERCPESISTGRGAHAFGEEPLEVWRGGAIVTRDRIPARLRPPGGLAHALMEQRFRNASLHGVERARSISLDAVREVFEKGTLR